MKILASCALVGAVLGAVVAVCSHFASRTLPGTYYVGSVRAGNRVDQTLGSPLVHPSWWPTLPVALAVGLFVGTVVGVGAKIAGVSVTRRARP